MGSCGAAWAWSVIGLGQVMTSAMLARALQHYSQAIGSSQMLTQLLLPLSFWRSLLKWSQLGLLVGARHGGLWWGWLLTAAPKQWCWNFDRWSQFVVLILVGSNLCIGRAGCSFWGLGTMSWQYLQGSCRRVTPWCHSSQFLCVLGFLIRFMSV